MKKINSCCEALFLFCLLSVIVAPAYGREIYHSSLLLPLGVSIGSTHHLFVRYQPCLNKLLKGDDDGKMDSNLLLFGVGIRLF
jgi:hypothetical protein